jgi:NarL family two-component system sensor histidine kinase YdfH
MVRAETVPWYDVPSYDGENSQAEYNKSMEKQSVWRKLIILLFSPSDREDFKAFRDILPFFLLVTAMMVWIYSLMLRTAPALEYPLRHGAFTTLMVVHLALYWLSFYFSITQRRTFIYMLIQGVIVFLIVLVTRSDIVVIALYTSLIGNVIGMLGKQSASIFAVVFYLALAIISLTIIVVSPQAKELLSTLLPVAGFTVFIAYFFNRQIEARMRMQFLLDELEEAHQQLTEYTVEVETLTLTNERQRMARELHDTLAQGLAGLILQLEAAVIHIEGQNTEKAQQIVEQAMARARTTLVDARKAIDDLRTDLSSPHALEEVLTREVERFRSATGIPCEVQITLPDQIDTQLSEHIVRTLTEGLWNIARHAQATQASVRVHTPNGKIEIEIMDDGIGFDPEDKVARSGHYGLLGIRERARLAGGQLMVNSEIGKGTHLRVSLPVEPLKEKILDE